MKLFLCGYVTTVSNPCYFKFPAILDYILELWIKITFFYLKVHLVVKSFFLFALHNIPLSECTAIYLIAEGHHGCFHVWGTMSKIAINIYREAVDRFGKCRSWLLGSVVRASLMFFKAMLDSTSFFALREGKSLFQFTVWGIIHSGGMHCGSLR